MPGRFVVLCCCLLLWSCGGNDSVAPPGPAAALVVTPNPGTLPQRGTLQLDAKVVDQNGQRIPAAVIGFSSADTTVATVSPGGLVTSLGPSGTVTIQVTSDTFSQQVLLSVTQVPTQIRITPNPAIISTGHTRQLGAVVLDAMGDTVRSVALTWTSNAPSLVTVDSVGLVSAIGDTGTASVSASALGLSSAVSLHILSVYHPTGQLAARTPVPGAAFAVAISPSDQVFVTLLTELLVTTTLPTYSFGSPDSIPGQPFGIAVNHAGTRIYVAGAPLFGLYVLDASTRAIVDSVTSLNPTTIFDVKVSADDQTLYVSGDDYFYKIDVATLAVTSLALPDALIHIAVSPTQPLVYASGRNTGNLYEINTQSMTLSRTIHTGTVSLQGVVVSPDGKLAYVVSEDGYLDVVSVSDGSVTTYPIACHAYGLVESLDGAVLYASCTSDGTVAMIDTYTYRITQTITTLGYPRREAISPDGATLAVADQSNWVSFIR